MGRLRRIAILAGVAAVAAAVAHRVQREAIGRHAEGGILIDDAAGYDRHTSRLLGGLYRSVADDIAANAAGASRVLEIGCGPGHLSVLLARDHGFEVTGLDLDPAMIERAEFNAASAGGYGPTPQFVVGDVAALPFPDASFDLVVSTFSMHHWARVSEGLTEIARVLRPGGRALVWDFRRGVVPFHANMPDPAELVADAPLRLVDASSWAWPWRLKLSRRLELARDDEAAEAVLA